MIRTYKYLPLHEEIGTAEIKGKKVKLCVNTNGTPMVVCENRVFTMPWEEILNIATEEGIVNEKDVCYKHSSNHNATWSQVNSSDCETLPCFKDCPLMVRDKGGKPK